MHLLNKLMRTNYNEFYEVESACIEIISIINRLKKINEDMNRMNDKKCMFPDALCETVCVTCADGFPKLHARLLHMSCIDWFSIANKHPTLRDKYIDLLKTIK